MTRIPPRFLTLFIGLPLLLSLATAQQSQSSESSLAKFAGNWEGKCQNGKTFVVLALQLSGNQVNGTVSIANMHGDHDGGCTLVISPPAPEHAQQIIHAVATQSTLSFSGSKRPDGSFARFELTEIGPDKAELKMLGTPVEKHPWLLVKSQKAE